MNLHTDQTTNNHLFETVAAISQAQTNLALIIASDVPGGNQILIKIKAQHSALSKRFK